MMQEVLGCLIWRSTSEGRRFARVMKPLRCRHICTSACNNQSLSLSPVAWMSDHSFLCASSTNACCCLRAAGSTRASSRAETDCGLPCPSALDDVAVRLWVLGRHVVPRPRRVQGKSQFIGACRKRLGIGTASSSRWNASHRSAPWAGRDDFRELPAPKPRTPESIG